MTTITLLCIALAIVASLAIVPLVRWLAQRLGVVDAPDSPRKLHRTPIALGGGLAVFLAVVMSFLTTIWLDKQFLQNHLGDIPSQWFVLLGCASAMLMLGLIDDAFPLRGRQKLLLQTLIIVGLVGSGTLIDELSLLGIEFSLGLLAFPVTVIWLLAAVNALNLIDGADGMATTAGCVICAGLGFISLRGEVTLSAVLAFAIAGALLGFLAFNRPPASIYLGDSGSMTIGLCVGVLAVWSSVKESTILSSAPVAILAIPLFDSTAAILRRWLTGRSIYSGDRAHLHHLLQERYGPVGMLLIVAGLCVTTTALSVLSVIYHQPILAAVGVLIVLGLLVLTRSFGHAEAKLLIGRASVFAQSFARGPRKHTNRCVPMQGVGKWDTIWEPLVEFASVNQLSVVLIDLNISWLHEGYHGAWENAAGLPNRDQQLSISLPLFARRHGNDQIVIGRLEIIAPANDPAVYQKVADLSDRLADLGPQIDDIVASLENRKSRSPSDQNLSEINVDHGSLASSTSVTSRQ